MACRVDAYVLSSLATRTNLTHIDTDTDTDTDMPVSVIMCRRSTLETGCHARQWDFSLLQL